ncbi:tRNA methyltransferase [Aureococcus anophagefferens]|nr:tRNA methyltransferase [Aureococcus anophagefferens]
MATHRGPCARYRKAKEEKFRARSAYKLMDVDDECCAGGARRRGRRRGGPAAHGAAGGVVVLRGDITTPETAAAVVAAAGGPADVVVCDGAPEVTGVHDVDEFAHASLMAAAAALAARLLRPGGAFVAKLFRCTDAALVEAQLRCLFVDVDVRKPASSRDRSVEAFVVARDFRGGRAAAGFLEKGDLGFAATAAEPPGLAVAAAWT